MSRIMEKKNNVSEKFNFPSILIKFRFTFSLEKLSAAVNEESGMLLTAKNPNLKNKAGNNSNKIINAPKAMFIAGKD
jgi:hypothetical protein